MEAARLTSSALPHIGPQREDCLDAQLALIDGTLDIMIAHRLDELAARVIEAMQLAHRQESGSFITLTSGFELITKENY